MAENSQGDNTAEPKQQRLVLKRTLELLRSAAAWLLAQAGRARTWSWQLLKWTTDGLNYASPALTAIATAGLVWLAYWQWDALHNTDIKIGKQLELAHQQLVEVQLTGIQTGRIIAANEKLAQAAADSAAIARSNLEATGAIASRQKQAKISIPGAELENFEAGMAPNVFVQIENTGQGTAHGKMRGVVKITPVVDTNFPIDRKVISANVAAHPSSKNSRTIQSFHRLSEGEIQAVMAGRSAIIVYGDYRFTDESKAVTLCIYRLFYRGGGTNAQSIGGPFVPAPNPIVSKPPTLRPTAGYNSCDEEKPAPSKPLN